VKKDVNPRWLPRNGCDGRLIAKILILNGNQGKFCCFSMFHYNSAPNSPELSLFKIFAINLPSQPFLGCHLVVHIFCHDGLPGGPHTFFTAGPFWG